MRIIQTTILGMALSACVVSAALAQCIPDPFPLGWLNAQEQAGGHTIARHVGRTDAQLVLRLTNNANIQNASTYTDLQTAELAITGGLAGVRVTINAWAENANHGQRRVDNFTAAANVGRVAFRPPNLANIVDSDRFRTVMQADGHGGCFLLTSFPTMPPPNDPKLLEESRMHVTVDENVFALAGYLAGQFADSDVSEKTDAELAKSEVDHISVEAHLLVIEQANLFLNDPTSNFTLVGDWANRVFATDAEAKNWLTKVIADLQDAVDDLD